MARVELPESRLRARKRRRRLSVLVFSLVIILLALSGLVGLTYWSSLQIKNVAISGAHTLPSSTVEAFVRDRLAGEYWYAFSKSNIFLYPRRQITTDLIQAYPVLASADVHAVDFHTIAVNVVERSPRALWCTSSDSAPSVHCFFMDENGIVYGEAPRFSEPVYLSYYGSTTGSALPKQFLTPPEFQALSALVDALAQKVSESAIAAVEVDANRDVSVRFANEFTLRFALSNAGGDVFERFSLALTSEPMTAHKLSDFQYLDLRFGDKLYYKLK